MNIGSLFSGAGIGDLGWLAAEFDIKWQVENDPFCRKVLDLRYPETKKYGDIKEVKAEELEPVDVVSGGFPCQPFSVSGKQRGEKDDRNLWPEMLRIIKSIRPSWIVGENVPGLINLYLDNVLSDLEAEGYIARTFVFSAHALGAWHKRERIWIVAHAGCQRQKKHEEQTAGVIKSSKNVADAPETKIKGVCERKVSTIKNDKSIWRNYWSTEPHVGRVVTGCPDRIHRLKAIGNSQVPACVYHVANIIKKHYPL